MALLPFHLQVAAVIGQLALQLPNAGPLIACKAGFNAPQEQLAGWAS